MPTVTFQDRSLALNAGETVLDGLLRNGVNVANSCRAGACQTCMLRAESGVLPPKAQAGLKETLRARGYFLACSCVPEGDLSVCMPGSDAQIATTISAVRMLSPDVAAVLLRPETSFEFRAGQYVVLIRADGLARSYSIASLPDDGELELHVRRIPGGSMSGWLHTQARPGDALKIQGPSGDCFYVPGRAEQSLLLAGTGTGLAPLIGVLRDALKHGHTGTVTLYHGGRTPAGLYHEEQLRAIAAEHPNVSYKPCVLEGAADGQHAGPLDTYILQDHKPLSGARIFLCGAPDFVLGMRKKLFLAGASYKEIFADAFLPSAKA